MPAELVSIGVLVLSWGATYLLHSTLLVAAVWIFLKIRRDAGHALRELLWKTALVGGLATATGQILLLPAGPLGNLTWMLPRLLPPAGDFVVRTATGRMSADDGPAERTNPDPARVDVAELDSDIWLIAEPDNGVAASENPSTSTAADLATGIKEAGPLTSATHGTATPLGAIAAVAPGLAIVFLAAGAMAIGMLRTLCQTLALSRKLAACAPLDDGPARDLLDELCRLVPRARRVRLLVAADDAEPAALGVWRWTIVLPRRAIADLSVDELRSLLAHELAHLARGDAAWLCISRFVCSCLAFQPLNHFARREWQRAAEFLCDKWAVHRTGSPLALARCLTEVAGWRLAAQSSGASLAATGRKSGLVDRIERLLDARPLAEAGDDRRSFRQAACYGGIGLVLLAWCAPRVTVIAAGIELHQPVEYRAPLSVTTTAGSSEDDRLAVAVTEVAKPQANGERELQMEGSESAGELQGASEYAQSKPAPERAPESVPNLLLALDRDLAALEAELAEIEPLLRNAAGTPQAVQLASRLHGEIDRLKQRRELLKKTWKLVGR